MTDKAKADFLLCELGDGLEAGLISPGRDDASIAELRSPLQFPAIKAPSPQGPATARASRFATAEAYHRPPRAERTPRWFSATVIASSEVAPDLRMDSIKGSTAAVNWSAAAI
jgi:hypothetical protein